MASVILSSAKVQEALSKLAGSDCRFIGKSNEVVPYIISELPMFELVFNELLSDDHLIRMRSADAIENIIVKYPEYLQPYQGEAH